MRVIARKKKKQTKNKYCNASRIIRPDNYKFSSNLNSGDAVVSLMIKLITHKNKIQKSFMVNASH